MRDKNIIMAKNVRTTRSYSNSAEFLLKITSGLSKFILILRILYVLPFNSWYLVQEETLIETLATGS